MIETLKAKEAHEDRLSHKSGVVGVGVGKKWSEGTPTDTQAILVFVDRKRTKKGIKQKFSAEDIIPDEIDGIPTDVIEVGYLKKFGFQQRTRPIKPGVSCSHRDVSAGTIGGIFLDRDNEPVILSNNHVLANENKGAIGDIILQPGVLDATGDIKFRGWPDPVAALPYFATLKRFVALGNNNIQDSAIARIHNKYIKSGMIDPLYPTINRSIIGFGSPTVGMQVQKCGRTTGYTTGRVIGTNTTFSIAYDRGPTKFSDCVVLSAMSKAGDSGSIILDMNMRAVAHLFAGSPKVTIANDIMNAVNEYGLKIWSPISAIGIDTLDFGDGTWRQISSSGKITKTDKMVTIKAPANQFCFLESEIDEFNSVSVIVNTGNDKGSTWGPGLTVRWPTGLLKINVRYNDKFGGYFNGAYNISVGAVKPNTDYTLRIRKSSGTYVGEIQNNGKWHTVIELPVSIFPNKPISVRVGKTDLTGGASNHTSAGQTGTCTFKNFIQN